MLAKHPYDQVVYLLQGGGALGTYQSGVCEALLESGYPPTWVVGTSIGAINASIIAGNLPEHRLEKLQEFWNIIAPPLPTLTLSNIFPGFADEVFLKKCQNFMSASFGVFFGQPGFYKPRFFNPWCDIASTPDKLSYYDTSELRATLKKVIDFKLINQQKIRLSLGSVHVQTGTAVRFDNTRQKIAPEHIMASCALPPGFPAIEIDGEYYWDGGILSNTPFNIILEERIAQKLLCFVVDLYSFPVSNPSSMMDLMCSTKDITYASRYEEVLHQFSEVHYLQRILHELSQTIGDNTELKKALKKINKIGHPTALNINRFHYKASVQDLWSRDFNFSPEVLKTHWQAGYDNVQNALKQSPWLEHALTGIHTIVHEF